MAGLPARIALIPKDFLSADLIRPPRSAARFPVGRVGTPRVAMPAAFSGGVLDLRRAAPVSTEAGLTKRVRHGLARVPGRT